MESLFHVFTESADNLPVGEQIPSKKLIKEKPDKQSKFEMIDY